MWNIVVCMLQKHLAYLKRESVHHDHHLFVQSKVGFSQDLTKSGAWEAVTNLEPFFMQAEI